MTTKNRILKMERRRQGGRRLTTRFPGMADEEFCAMIGVPVYGATDEQLLSIVQSGVVEDWTVSYRPRPA